MKRLPSYVVKDEINALRDGMCAPIRGLLSPDVWSRRAIDAVKKASSNENLFNKAIEPFGFDVKELIGYTDLANWMRGLLAVSKEGKLLFVYAHSGESEPFVVQGVRQLECVEGRNRWHYWVLPSEPWGIASVQETSKCVFLVENELIALHMRLAFEAQQMSWQSGPDADSSIFSPSPVFIAAPPNGRFDEYSINRLRNHIVICVHSSSASCVKIMCACANSLSESHVEHENINFEYSVEAMEKLSFFERRWLAVDFEVVMKQNYSKLFERWVSGLS